MKKSRLPNCRSQVPRMGAQRVNPSDSTQFTALPSFEVCSTEWFSTINSLKQFSFQWQEDVTLPMLRGIYDRFCPRRY